MSLCLCGFVFPQFGYTGLHFAASNNQYNVASALLNWGAEVDAVMVSQHALYQSRLCLIE